MTTGTISKTGTDEDEENKTSLARIYTNNEWKTLIWLSVKMARG